LTASTALTSPPPGKARSSIWSRLAYAYAIVMALGVGYFMFLTPYQVSDNLSYILVAQASSYGELLAANFTGRGSIRPLMWLQQKVLFHLAPDGQHMTTFKLFHVAQLVALVILVVRLLRVRTAIDCTAVPLAVTALLGIHTFSSTVREGYPINHFMTVLVLCLGAANLAASRHRWWHDVAAMLVVAYALFLFETGILAWVCLVAAYLGGWRGVSGRALVGTTVVLMIYLALRFAILDVGSRGVGAMDSGFGFAEMGGPELRARFGDSPWLFYLYNITSAALSVLLSEPREGVFQFTRDALAGELPPWSAVNVGVSTIGTALIGFYVYRRVRNWKASRLFEYEDVVLLLCFAVWAANAVMTYPYLKEVVMSPAGVFYAIALFLATRDLLRRMPDRWLTRAFLVAPLLLLATGWSFRTVTLVAGLGEIAFTHRNDWAMAEAWVDENNPAWRAGHPDAERLVHQLRDEIIEMPVPQPYTMRWTRGWVDPY
jgi:hypothetical protein